MPLNAQNALNPTLLTMLACPSDDHAPLREESLDGADTLVCTYCATRFPIDDGIPVLLLDDATPGPNGIGVAAAEPTATGPADAPIEQAAPAVLGEPDLPVDLRVSPKHALPDTPADTGPADPPEIAEAGGVFDTAEVEDAAEAAEAAEFDGVLHAAPEVEEVAAGPGVEADADIDADPGADGAVPTVPAGSEPASPDATRRPPTPAPGPRTLAAALRNRVEHRLAEHEANRGPRRRRGTGR